MLIEFSVENYKSIKERQTLSMATASPDKDAKRCVIKTGFTAAPNLLETIAIYGPNGAGKSNLISALDFFQDLVASSHKLQPNEPINDVKPFLFSTKTQKQPSKFEMVFIHEKLLFQYGFTADSKRIHDEWLYATDIDSKKQKAQTWFERDSKDIKASSVKKELKGARETWKEGTGKNQLFLSVAANRQSVDFKKPFEWITDRLHILPAPSVLSKGFTASQIHKNHSKDKIIKLMLGLDVSFDDVQVIERAVSQEDFEGIERMPKAVLKAFQEEVLKDIIGKKMPQVFTIHKMEDGEHYPLPLEEESEGTQQLFAFSGPIIDVLDNGYTLIVDEIHNSLHPLALKGIVSLFQNSESNNKQAQLIFTTHDTTAMGYLSRDQIWLLDKGEFGDTRFTALSEFSGRADEAIEKRYLGGRYGALPNIKGVYQ